MNTMTYDHTKRVRLTFENITRFLARSRARLADLRTRASMQDRAATPLRRLIDRWMKDRIGCPQRL